MIEHQSGTEEQQVWTRPELTYVGSVGDVLQWGQVSPCNGDGSWHPRWKKHGNGYMPGSYHHCD